MSETDTNDRIQPGVKVRRELWERFREAVSREDGAVRGNLGKRLETAIEDHIRALDGADTHGRLTRIENRIEDVAEAVESDADSDSRTDSVSTTTENRIADIMSDVRQRAKEIDSKQVRESDVEAAIERNAGTSYKTIQRYKKLLQNQRQLFAHPIAEDVYFIAPEPFIACVEQHAEVPTHERDEIADAYGWDWWEREAPNGLIDDDRGFE